MDGGREPTRAEELIAESKDAIRVLTELTARLEAYVGDLYHEAARQRAVNEKGDSDA